MQTGYYGYPYDYLPHPSDICRSWPIMAAELLVGAAFYREAAWPAKYQNTDFSCEWGKGKIQRFTVTKKGASFESNMEDFMTNDGSGELRPLDVDFSPDGKTMYVADWNYGGWCNPKICGRLFRITYTGAVMLRPNRTAPRTAIRFSRKSVRSVIRLAASECEPNFAWPKWAGRRRKPLRPC